MKILDFFSKYQKFIILGGLLISVLSFIDGALGVGAIFVLFLAAVFFFVIGKCKEAKQRRILGTLFLVVFALYILFVLFFYYTKFQPFSNGYGDYVVYHQQAQQIAQRVHQGNLSFQGMGLLNCYPLIVGYIYALTIPSMLIGQLFNAWLVAILIVFVYLIIREIGGTEKEGFLTGIIACFYPSLAFYGSLLLKDAMVVLLCMIGLLLTVKIAKNFSIAKFICFFVILTGLVHLRFYVGYTLMFGFIISWFLISNFNLKKRIKYGIIIFIILGFCPLILGNGYYGLTNLKTFLNVKTITFYREIVYAPKKVPVSIQLGGCEPSNCNLAFFLLPERRNSSVVVKTGFENPVTFVKNTAISFLYSFLGPFPWQLTSLRQFLVLPEVIVWYFLLFFIIRGTIEATKKRNKDIIPLIIFSILVIGVLSLFMDNFGIITRIRMPAFLTLLCLLPLGFKKLKDINMPLLKKLYE